MKKLHSIISSSGRQIISYLKDYRFSSILLRYFLLLFVCLMMPMTLLSIWYGQQMKENLYKEMINRNEAALSQTHDNVSSIIISAENLVFSLSQNQGVAYIATRDSLGDSVRDYVKNLQNTLSLLVTANRYIESACVYFQKSDSFVSNTGAFELWEYGDAACLEQYHTQMGNRTVLFARKGNNQYPYLLTVLYPVGATKEGNSGVAVININVEKLGDYIGSGKYRNKDYSPMLLVLDKNRENIVYSDEYRLLSEGISSVDELLQSVSWEEQFSQLCDMWGGSHIVSGMYSGGDGFWYIYISSMNQFETQNHAANALLVNVVILTGILCLVLACMLATWVYKPIRKTISVLDNMSMLTQWDKKEHIDEMEAIQRSILEAKKEQENLNERMQERMVSLHNAQICALQTQINPHFLYNTLESISNAAALLMGEENKVTKMVYTLGRLMRISLAAENYLVPIEEELEHVKLYVELMEFRFRGHIRMHIDIPEEMYQERIVKLTLQPLIENAIDHGLTKKRNQGNIWIKGECREDELFLYVIDDGNGISDEQMEKLQKKLKVSTISDSRHIGMRNVNQRIKLVFGEDYGLSVSCEEGGGTQVCVHFKRI